MAEHDMKIVRYFAEGAGFNLGAAGAKQTSIKVLEYSAIPRIGKKENRELNNLKARRRPNKASVAFDVTVRCLMRYGELDAFLAAAFRDTAYSAAVKVTDTVYDVSSVDNSINDAGAGFITDGYLANQLLRTSGFTLAANNGIGKISTLAAGKMVMLGIDYTTEAVGDTVIVDMGSQIVNGTTVPTFAWEEEKSDVGGDFYETRGCALSRLTITVNNDEELVVEMTFIGVSQTFGAVTFGDGTPTAASTNAILMYSNMSVVYEANASVTLSNTFNINFDPKLRPRDFDLGSLTIASFGCGLFECNGTLQYLLANETIYDKLQDCSESSLILGITDAAGNSYGIEVVAMEYDSITDAGGGSEEDMLKDAAFNGHQDGTELVMARIARFPA